ncbi:MAG: hypothetical protein EA420_05695 [Candidatus Competibacteraceae bacterium]|nr:MAG: hypothetical protein EA420_05695 [Candidatus Competibacteraceae bacterium]
MSMQTNPISSLGSFGQQHFTNIIEGIYGTFSTPAGCVCYLQTKAKIGGDGSSHSQLTRSIIPAREALNIQEMDFNQLLQRDLDDHRIATKLIPYILNPPSNSLPGFFPPIVAVLLPFDHQQQPIDYFDLPEETIEVDHQYGLKFRMVSHGRAYRIQYLVGNDNKPANIPLAVLRWNPDEAKLVIMDGQHRAMALLAIERTITKSWYTAPKGARYQPFYEQHVQNWLDNAKKRDGCVDLSKIELPVTICWFPEPPGQDLRPKPHRAARKIFVDVNNTAKPPSEARLVLLSDTELANILARELLNRLRRDDQWRNKFPLFGVEYDNPIKSITTPRRWSVVTNLEILKDSVVRSVFGPSKIIESAAASLQGKPAYKDMSRYMREQLQVDKLFEKEFHDGPHRIVRENLSNEIFPINDNMLHEKLLNAFYDRWGKGILYLFSEVEPYKVHLKALQDRYTFWTAADNVQTLAKDALFEGVGMFWTIEDGHQLWLDQKKEAQENKLSSFPPQPDISKAWTILEDEQKKIFRKLRAKMYLNSEADKDVDDSDRLFQSLITYAAQVGLVLAWATMHRISARNIDPYNLAKEIASSINKTLTSGPVKSRDRRRILLKSSYISGFKVFNELPKLEPIFATHFRYFWLELILHDGNRESLTTAGVDTNKALDFLEESRRAYLKVLIDERRKQRMKDSAIRSLPDPKKQVEKADKLAKSEVIEGQAHAHQYWFGGTVSEEKKILESTLARGTTSEVDKEDEDAENDDEFGNEEETDIQI